MSDGDKVIKLNVGGALFTTTEATLTQYPGSMLAAMFDPESERPPAMKDDQGNFVIDRNPRAFEYILGFLRNATLDKEIDGCSVEELEKEATYFGLKKMVEIIKAGKRSRKERKRKAMEELEKAATELQRATGKWLILDSSVRAEKANRNKAEEERNKASQKVKAAEEKLAAIEDEEPKKK